MRQSLLALGGLLALAAPMVRAQSPSTGPAATMPAASRPGSIDTTALRPRAVKVIGGLHLPEAEKIEAAVQILLEHYAALQEIHADREARAKASRSPSDKQPAPDALAAVESESTDRLRQRHAAFLSKMSGVLSGEQIESLKDEMTERLMTGRLKRYEALAPEMTEAQRAHVRSLLVEWREGAMDIVDLKAQDRTIGKVEGKINNYLIAEGHRPKKTTTKPTTARSAD